MDNATERHTRLQRLVLTGSGKDKPGLVAGLTGLILAFEGNIEDSTMTRLAGQFATIVIVALPETVELEAFRQAVTRLEQELAFQLSVQVLSPKESEQATAEAEQTSFMITVGGQDRTGLTHRIASLLADASINITDLNAHQIQGEDGPVYLMVIEADVPNAMPQEALKALLKPVADELNLDVRVHTINTLAF